MAHAAKYASAAVGHLAAHYERRKDGKGEYVKFGNQDIDLQRTHLNYNLAPQRKIGQREFIRQRLSEVPHAKRKDLIVMCDWVVTLPKEIKSMTDRELPPIDDVSRIFFDRTYHFLTDRYGEENTASSYVHLDEVSRHMHYSFVPVVEDKKNGGWKISAKDLISRKELRAFHTELERYLDSFGDIHFGVINEATKEGNRTVAELKQAANIEKTAETAQKLDKATQELRAIEQQIEPLRAIKADVEAVPVERKPLRWNKKEVKVDAAALDRVEQQAKVGAVLKEKQEYVERYSHIYAAQEERIGKMILAEARGKDHVLALEREVPRLRNDLAIARRENTDLKQKNTSLEDKLASMEASHAAEMVQLTAQHSQRVLDLRRYYERELKRLQQKKKIGRAHV